MTVMRNLVIVTCAALAATLVPAALYAEAPQDASRIAYEEFKKLADKDGVLIIDVRGRESYLNGHIPGAIVISFGEIESRASELRGEKRPIVTYCA